MAKPDGQGGAVFTHVEVASFAKRFCEIGRSFYPEPVLIALDGLDDEALAVLEGSPHLRVRRVVVAE